MADMNGTRPAGPRSNRHSNSTGRRATSSSFHFGVSSPAACASSRAAASQRVTGHSSSFFGSFAMSSAPNRVWSSTTMRKSTAETERDGCQERLTARLQFNIHFEDCSPAM
jgi:hypothetical protein